MSVNLPDSVREKLKSLRIRYVESLPERREALQAALDRISQGDSFDRELYFEAQNAAHKFVGSGETFGFSQISNVAREIETLFEGWIKNQKPPSIEESQKVKNLMEQLSQLCEKAQAEEASSHRSVGTEAGHMHHNSLEVFGKKQIFIWQTGSPLLEDIQEQLGFFGYPITIVSSIDPITQWMEKDSLLVLLVILDPRHLNEQVFINIKQLKEFNKTEKLKVLFLSERDDFITRLLAIRHGGDSFISRPFDIPRILEKIDLLFNGIDKTPYHVMIIDDDPEQISYYAMILQQAGMVTSVVTDPKNVMRVLVEEQPELILMDMYMPDCKGEELSALIRQQEAFVGIPIVYFSIEKDRDKQITALQKGIGDDFITKPIKPDHLVTMVKTRAYRIRQLRYFMERDSLTGLLNHTQLRLRLVSELDRARRLGTQVVYGMIDLDHFKKVNDEHGHLLGDHVLKTLSRLFVERLRKTDALGRYGGEEFGVVLFHTNLENGVRVLDELRESFSRIRHRGNEKDFFVTFSCGVADFPRFPTADALVEAADRALYEAKRQGRNCVYAAP
ncbi:MAG: diguanylate cyclase [Spirochaetales bacterium]